jgi:hypothetical protein
MYVAKFRTNHRLHLQVQWTELRVQGVYRLKHVLSYSASPFFPSTMQLQPLSCFYFPWFYSHAGQRLGLQTRPIYVHMQESTNAHWSLSTFNPFENLNCCYTSTSGHDRNRLNYMNTIYSCNIRADLMKWVQVDKFLLGPATRVILGSESRWAHGHILLPHDWPHLRISSTFCKSILKTNPFVVPTERCLLLVTNHGDGVDLGGGG